MVLSIMVLLGAMRDPSQVLWAKEPGVCPQNPLCHLPPSPNLMPGCHLYPETLVLSLGGDLDFL